MESLFSGLLAFFEKSWKLGAMLAVACALIYALDFYNIPDKDSLKQLLPYAALCGVIGVSIIVGTALGATVDAVVNSRKKNAKEIEKKDSYNKKGVDAAEYVKHLSQTHIRGLALIIQRYDAGSFVLIRDTQSDDLTSKYILTTMNDTGYEKLCFVHPKVMKLKEYIINMGSKSQFKDFTLEQYLTKRIGVW
ncbi:hypothetical protein V5F29_00660 [Xanthobacter aminoxidans]|uniref:hypothetical protein n=1 Tax=Xanthobacter aminoxidans TaxID=186280 RepID=UPI003726999F